MTFLTQWNKTGTVEQKWNFFDPGTKHCRHLKAKAPRQHSAVPCRNTQITPFSLALY